METPEHQDIPVPAAAERHRPGLPVETPRLTLRTFRDDDVDPLFAIQGNHDAMRYTYTAFVKSLCSNAASVWYYCRVSSTLRIP
jgi:hypothetical protein